MAEFLPGLQRYQSLRQCTTRYGNMGILIIGIDPEVSRQRHGLMKDLHFANEEIEYMLPNDEVCNGCIF
jgi:hypothetical protein